MRQPPCLTIVEPCGDDPGYPEQNYDSANAPCPTVAEFVAVADTDGSFKVADGGVLCGGNVVVTGAISEATLSDFVDSLQTAWAGAGQAGTWSLVSEEDLTFQLDDTTCGSVSVAFTTGT